jgi:ketosteroid isomerase-like protein
MSTTTATLADQVARLANRVEVLETVCSYYRYADLLDQPLAPTSALGAEVQRLVARTQILETVYSYCRHADLLDAPGMADHFTADCVVTFHHDGPTLRGREELQERLAARLSLTLSGSHHISNEELIFEESGAVTGHLYMYSWQRFEGHPKTPDVHRWGRYEMRFIEQAEGWRIQRMRLLSAGEYGSHRIGEQLHSPWPPQFS